MTQPSALPNPPQEPARNDHIPSLADCLLHLLLNLLTPMFLIGSNGNVHIARTMALGTINAYRARDEVDLISVAQVIAFGLATLGSLSLSMADDLSLNMILRLRGNANACNRSGEQHRRALRQSRPTDDPPRPEAPVPTAPQQAPPAPAAAPAPVAHPPVMGQDQAIWAAAMAAVAEEYAAELPNLPPEERELAVIRANALNYCLNELSSGSKAPPPDPVMTGRPHP